MAACKPLGFVEAPDAMTVKDVTNEMRNKTAILGGNVLLVTHLAIKATGVAYLCEPPPK